jgi:hypothetical protein
VFERGRVALRHMEAVMALESVLGILDPLFGHPTPGMKKVEVCE